MPRGFLVKRHFQCASSGGGGLHAQHLETSRIRRNSEEDRSDSGSEHEYAAHDRIQSPDSGFSASPLALTTRERSASPSTRETTPEPTGPQSRSLSAIQPYYVPSSLNYYHHHTASTYSPFYFSTFNRLAVTSPTGKDTTVTGALVPRSPTKKRNNDSITKPKANRKSKAARRLNFTEVKNSPVSGTFIRDSDDEDAAGDMDSRVVRGDIDGSLNFVEVTEEAKSELAKIENKIGDYVCQLCKEWFEDAFRLAQHRCSRIVHIEYRCPECDKVFNCPANLASHRRWHKPRPNGIGKTSGPSKILPAPPVQVDPNTPLNLAVKDRTDLTPGTTPITPTESETLYSCNKCEKKFRRRAYLIKHQQTHKAESESTDRRPENEKCYPCRYCGLVLSSEEYLAKHLLQHNDEAKHLLQHNDEASVITGNGSYTPNTHHSNGTLSVQPELLYKCKHCTSVFYTSAALTRHINKRHPTDTKQVILLNLPTPRMNRQ